MIRLFLPQICLHCGLHCDDDNAKKEALAKYLCPICLRQCQLSVLPGYEDLAYNATLLKELPFDVQIRSSFTFQTEGIIQSLIHHFKYMEMPKLARTLGLLCCKRNGDIFGKYDYLVPIPLHRTRYSERGYNQSEMLAQGMNAFNSVPVAGRHWLKRIRQTPSQTGLSVREREENVRGAFVLTEKGKKKLLGKKILLIDDVMTTGATLASAASALALAKPKKIDLFAMAAVTGVQLDVHSTLERELPISSGTSPTKRTATA